MVSLFSNPYSHYGRLKFLFCCSVLFFLFGAGSHYVAWAGLELISFPSAGVIGCGPPHPAESQISETTDPIILLLDTPVLPNFLQPQFCSGGLAIKPL